MTKEKALLLFGAIVVLLLVSVPCVGYLQIWSLLSHDEGLPTEVPKGMLAAGVSSGRQTITNKDEAHTYEFSGTAGQSIEIRVHPFADVHMSGAVWAADKRVPLATAFRDHGDNDLVMTVELPSTTIYHVFVRMIYDDTGDYEMQLDILAE